MQQQKCLYVLMLSMQTCILGMIFVMESLLLKRENFSADIQIGDNLTDEYLKLCIIIWKKQALSCFMWWPWKRICWDTVHNPSTNTHHISSATGQLSQSAVWYRWIVYMRISCILFLSNSIRTAARKQTPVYSSLNGCYTRLCTPLSVCTMCCRLKRQYSQEVLYTST